MDLERFKNPRFAQQTDQRILYSVIYTETKALQIVYPASFIEAARKSTYKFTISHFMDVHATEKELRIVIKKHFPKSFSSEDLGSICIYFNENGGIQTIYDERGVATDLNIEDNITEETYKAIKLSSAVINIFTAIYYIIEARRCFNNELFKEENHERSEE